MIFDVNFDDDDLLVIPWWRPVQWGWRGVPGDRQKQYFPSKPYRYFIFKLPVWWYMKDRFHGAIKVRQDGKCTYRRRWERLTVLWTDYPGLRWHWERAELSF